MYQVTIVLATYNGEHFIFQQLESIKKQTVAVKEVIIYDDCSKDRTYSIIEAFIKNNALDWKLYSQNQNVGYIKNFASALEKATGDIIFLCDQDDIWDENKVEKIMQLFVENENMMCVNTSFTYMDENQIEIEQLDHGTNYNMLFHTCKPGDYMNICFKEIVYHNISMGCTMAFRSSIKDIYIEKSLRIAPHDWEINAISSLSNGLYFFNEKLMCYRIHTNNVMGNDRLQKRRNSNRLKNASVMRDYVISLKEYNLNNEQSTLWKQLCELYEDRYTLLAKRKISRWIKLLRNFSNYHKIVSYKGMIMDLLYQKD